MVRQWQQIRLWISVILLVDTASPDYVTLAKAYNIEGQRVSVSVSI
jgi:thiamine pyrophosphate-dependent acetolactate synthase large subunit-like protein